MLQTSLISSRFVASSLACLHRLPTVRQAPISFARYVSPQSITASSSHSLVLRQVHTHTGEEAPQTNRRVSAIILSALGLSGIVAMSHQEEERTIHLSKNIAIRSDISLAEMNRLVEKLVKYGDQEALQTLIYLIEDLKFFPCIQSDADKEACINHLQNTLIRERNLTLIRQIFPLFSAHRLKCSEKYAEPIKCGDKELVVALHEGGLLLSKDSGNAKADMFLYSAYEKEYAITMYFIEYAGYEVHKPYPFSVKKVGDGVAVDLTSQEQDQFTLAELVALMHLLETNAAKNGQKDFSRSKLDQVRFLIDRF